MAFLYEDAKKTGTIFIPAAFVEELVLNAEFVALRDDFGHLRLKEGNIPPGKLISIGQMI